MEERRKHILTDDDVNQVIEIILRDDNMDKFAEKIEERFAKRFYSGLGRGIWGFAWKGIILIVFVLAAYGTGKGWHIK